MNITDNILNLFGGIHRDFWICCFLFISIVAIYKQTGNYDFISLDDPSYVTENLHVLRGMTADNIKWAFRFSQPGDMTYYHPLTWLSHMMDYRLFGLSAGAHHLSSVAYHILNSFLLFFLLRLMTGQSWKSGFVAVVFAVHPMNVDSVAWIAERKNLLSSFFWFFTLISYTVYVKKRSFFKYCLVFLFMVTGLLAKPILVTIPCIFLLLDLWPLEQFVFFEHPSKKYQIVTIFKKLNIFIQANRYLLLEKIPFFLLSVVWVYISRLSNQYIGGMVSTQVVPMNLRISNAILSYIKYLLKIIWPDNFAIYYPFPHKMMPIWQILGAAVVLFCISYLIIRKWKQLPWLTVGWLWYIGTLVPVSGIMMNGLWPAMADRWVYIPVTGILIIMTWGITSLTPNGRLHQTILSLCAISFILIMIINSYFQVSHWKNSITIFEHAIHATKNNEVAHNYLGQELIDTNPEKAIEHFKKAITIHPRYALSYFNLGRIMSSRGKNPEAEQYYQKALAIKPDFAVAHAAYGTYLMDQENLSKAKEHFYQAIKYQPTLYRVYNNLGNLFKKQNKIEDAVIQYEKALSFNPMDAISHYNLSTALADQGKIKEAIYHYQKAIQLKPEFAEAHNGLGLLYRKKSELTKAIQYFKSALHAQNDFSEAQHNLGITLLETGNSAEAIKQIIKYLDRNPNNAEAHNSLGLAFAAQENFKDAERHYKEALRLSPSLTMPYNNLGVLYYREYRYGHAKNCFQSGLEIDPNNYDLLNNLSILQKEIKKNDAIIENLKNKIKTTPDNPEIYYYLGIAYQKKGDLVLSITMLQKALSINPDFTPALNALALFQKSSNSDGQTLK